MSAQRVEQMTPRDLIILANSMGYLDVVEVTIDDRIASNYWHACAQTPRDVAVSAVAS